MSTIEAASEAAIIAAARAARVAGHPASALAQLQAAFGPDCRRIPVLLERAAAFRALGRAGDASDTYQQILGFSPRSGHALIGLAKLAQDDGDLPSALDNLERALTVRSDDRPLRLDIGRLQNRLARFAAAVETLAVFLDPAEAAGEKRLPALHELAKAAQAAGRLDIAEQACAALLAANPADTAALAWSGNCASQRGEAATALGFYEKALATNPADPTLNRNRAQALIALNRPTEAAAILETLLHAAADDLHSRLALALLRRGEGRIDEAVAHLRHAAALPIVPFPHARVGGTLRELGYLDEARTLLEAVRDAAPDLAAALAQLGYLYRQLGEETEALTVFRRAAERRPDDPLLLFEVASSLADLNCLDEAELAFARLAAMPGADANPVLQVRQFERACRTLRYADAMRLLPLLGDPDSLPANVVSWSIGLHAGRHDWPEVLRLFHARVASSRGDNAVPANEMICLAAGRAARACSRQAETLAWLDAMPALTPSARNLREVLAEELALLRALAPADCAAQPSDPNPAQDLPPFRARRAARLAEALRQPAIGATGQILLCSDRNYLLGAAVTLASLLRHNRAALGELRINIALSDDALDEAPPVLGAIAAAHGADLRIMAAASFARPDGEFRTSWGDFAVGHALSDAAYHRILAALHLAGEGYQGRLLYIDSDTRIGPGLPRLLGFDLNGQPVAARREQAHLSGVRRAARKTGVPLEQYFNSGVLLLDLGHPDCVDGLKRALNIAITAPEKLSHCDQCALNIGFHGQSASLPHGFNAFIRPDGDETQAPDNAVIRHYVAAPKPWDPAYPSDANAAWIDEVCALADILAAAQLRALFSIPFEQKT